MAATSDERTALAYLHRTRAARDEAVSAEQLAPEYQRNLWATVVALIDSALESGEGGDPSP